MRLLLDMNISPTWVEALAADDVVHWSAVGDPGASDHTILEYARRHGQILVTHDLDFGAILAATGGRAPSVLLIRGHDLADDAIRRLVVKVVREKEDHLAKGALMILDGDRQRIRMLPLPPPGERMQESHRPLTQERNP